MPIIREPDSLNKIEYYQFIEVSDDYAIESPRLYFNKDNVEDRARVKELARDIRKLWVQLLARCGECSRKTAIQNRSVNDLRSFEPVDCMLSFD